MDPQEAFQYCPRCQAALNKQKPRKAVCPKCAWTYYFNPIPCNGVIITNDDDDILLVERKSDPFKGYWDLPGGFLELLETVEESVIREVKEEIGVEFKVTELKLFMTSVDRYLYKGVKDYTLGLIYYAKLPEGAVIKPDDDVSAAKFFSGKDIPWDKIAFQSIRNILKQFLDKH
jgi:ADP-ribose pyrophosphatase YjhB (NUDIX family)